MALTIVPPVETPALVAVDCMQLFSRIDICDRARPSFMNDCQTA